MTKEKIQSGLRTPRIKATLGAAQTSILKFHTVGTKLYVEK